MTAEDMERLERNDSSTRQINVQHQCAYTRKGNCVERKTGHKRSKCNEQDCDDLVIKSLWMITTV